MTAEVVDRPVMPTLSTADRVAFACALIGATAGIAFGIASIFSNPETFGLIAGTGGALFGVSIEPLWGTWRAREQARRRFNQERLGIEKPAITPMFSAEKLALALAVLGGLSAIAFSIAATKTNPIVFGGIAVTSGALFGVSVEPLWKSWRRYEAERRAERLAQEREAEAEESPQPQKGRRAAMELRFHQRRRAAQEG